MQDGEWVPECSGVASSSSSKTPGKLSEIEKEKTKLRERQRRAITTKIFSGLRKYGGYNLPPRADINDVLKALANEAGWIVEPDGTTYRSSQLPSSTSNLPLRLGGDITPLSSASAPLMNDICSELSNTMRPMFFPAASSSRNAAALSHSSSNSAAFLSRTSFPFPFTSSDVEIPAASQRNPNLSTPMISYGGVPSCPPHPLTSSDRVPRDGHRLFGMKEDYSSILLREQFGAEAQQLTDISHDQHVYNISPVESQLRVRSLPGTGVSSSLFSQHLYVPPNMPQENRPATDIDPLSYLPPFNGTE